MRIGRDVRDGVPRKGRDVDGFPHRSELMEGSCPNKPSLALGEDTVLALETGRSRSRFEGSEAGRYLKLPIRELLERVPLAGLGGEQGGRAHSEIPSPGFVRPDRRFQSAERRVQNGGAPRKSPRERLQPRLHSSGRFPSTRDGSCRMPEERETIGAQSLCEVWRVSSGGYAIGPQWFQIPFPAHLSPGKSGAFFVLASAPPTPPPRSKSICQGWLCFSGTCSPR